MHVGENGPAATAGVLASSGLRGADRIPPAVTKPTEPATTTTAVAPPAAPTLKGALPVGKGMWMYQPKAVEGGNPHAIVARAKAVGLTHIFVRTGSSKTGFYAGDFLAKILPVAHAGGIRIYGWDFPYLDDIRADVDRAVDAITFTTPDGHRIDGFSADIEFPSMGVNLTPENAQGATAWPCGRRWVRNTRSSRPSPARRTRSSSTRTTRSSRASTPSRRWSTGSTASR